MDTFHEAGGLGDIHSLPALPSSPPERACPLSTDGAGALAAVGLIAPERLHREGGFAEGDILQSDPGALVAVLAGRDIVPAVLCPHLVAGVGHRLGVFVAGHDAVAVEVAVPEGIVGID